ncbi:BRISC complex subunit Abraxas 2-like [Ornithodoros turicata]|uniref:BRISC complex subunit Abraxas 2-like n=1 Tax=Ornithodoros turicata TaxID=34597 RepID=UPI0031387D05
MAAVTVTMSGALLASLIYENTNNSGDQEGFLLGEVTSRITDTISDSQLHGETEETNLKICSMLPCGQYQLYDKQCCLNQEKVASVLARREVVGWYRFRRQSALQVSLREQAIHQRLSQWVTQSDLFLLALFRAATSPNGATHSMDHVFLLGAGEKRYRAVPLQLVNLAASHTDYHLYPGSAASIHQGAFSQLLASATQTWTAGPVLQLHSQLQGTLQMLQDQVAESEAQVAASAKEVAQLRQGKISELV